MLERCARVGAVRPALTTMQPREHGGGVQAVHLHGHAQHGPVLRGRVSPLGPQRREVGRLRAARLQRLQGRALHALRTLRRGARGLSAGLLEFLVLPVPVQSSQARARLRALLHRKPEGRMEPNRPRSVGRLGGREARRQGLRSVGALLQLVEVETSRENRGEAIAPTKLDFSFGAPASARARSDPLDAVS